MWCVFAFKMRFKAALRKWELTVPSLCLKATIQVLRLVKVSKTVLLKNLKQVVQR